MDSGKRMGSGDEIDVDRVGIPVYILLIGVGTIALIYIYI
jgi:hypothetical protein